MTRKEKCELAILRGYIYNPETGIIYNKLGKVVNNRNKDGYIRISTTISLKKGIVLAGHQFAWYWVYKECVEQIDHINGIRDDNKICNLRAVTHQQNQWNRINVKGYSLKKNEQKWRSSIVFNNKKIHLGGYNTEQEARNAYLEAKQKYHAI
jgi:hypothetical protein